MTFLSSAFRRRPVTMRGKDNWPAVWVIMAGIFAIVTAEILPIGLLLPIAAEFTVTAGVSGVTMAIPGLVAAVAAPLATAVAGRTDRRTLLIAWAAVLAVSNVISAVATQFWMILAARILVGVVIGGFWSIGAGLAHRLVTPQQVSRATSTIFLAVPLGSVLGVPLGTLIADVAGWRTAFVALAGLSILVLIALAGTVPTLPATAPTRLAVLGGLLRRRPVRTGLTVTVLLVLAHFGTYTYVSAFLTDVTHIDLGTISALLLIYGAAGLVGNVVAGFTMSRSLRLTFGAAGALIAGATLLLPLLGGHIAGALALLVVWGLGYGMVPACSQTWLARAAGDDEAATVLFTSSFQATIAVAALSGGLVLDRWSPTMLLAAGGIAALAALGVIAGAGRRG